LTYEVLSGNTADKTTLRAFVKKIENQYGKADRIWLMDRGVLGAGLVISSGSTPQSMALARQSGAHHVFDYKRDDIAAEIARLTGGLGADLVFDATYSEAGFVETAKTVRRGGSWVVLGVGPGKTTRVVETDSPVDSILAPSAVPSMSTSTCCATSPNPPRWTARRRPSSSAAWVWRWSGRCRGW